MLTSRIGRREERVVTAGGEDRKQEPVVSTGGFPERSAGRRSFNRADQHGDAEARRSQDIAEF